ncbi:hypothetical protein ONS95_006686 [Cadophora gregata]|uniref:uncharacterized protein n=1 Tax=Cadophora gregata TaxID=51156 RepID=UPI0026DCC1D9|nr:uncharacterized protein ONS95_006686 [Cadophora gregata]KAK0101518.1 hypothetical protein ONS95_006686 [Cadophora gregata]KAK0106467.1 hypothetical protein ONS96_004096 [Cadophora gregata f. sp. sojae]
MAKVLEDSDDEFPDLAEIIHRKVASGKPAPSGSCLAKKAKTADDSFAAPANDRPTRGRTGDSRTNSKKGEGTETAQSRPRKRILNQTTDNTLLRPLANSTPNRSRSHGMGTSPAKTEVQKQKLSRHQPSNGFSYDRLQQDAGSEYDVESQPGGLPKAVKRTARNPKAAKYMVIAFESDEEDYQGTSGVSDFIVGDSSFLDEKSAVEASPPRPARKLVQGRGRPIKSGSSDSEDLGCRMNKLNVDDDVFPDSKKATRDLEDFVENRGVLEPSTGALNSNSEGTYSKRPKASKTIPESDLLTSDEEDPFILSYSPSENKIRNGAKETQFVTPPGSPDLKPNRLQSPRKQFPRIPSTPHRPSMDEFWQQDVVNDWNDEYSPQKNSARKSKASEDARRAGSPKKRPVKQGGAAREAKKAFSQSKNSLAESFLMELDTKITNGEISKLSASTGGVKIIWSKKLNTTAGRANWKRETIKSSASASDGKTTYRHHAAIELAEKVIDDEERLLNVIAHEFCHLANFMVSNIKTNPHGKEFKAWAAKCSRHFVDRGIEVTTRHNYAIDYKYIWECQSCGTEFKRHSRSIDPTRHQCGSCKSKLVQTKPLPRANTGTAKFSEYQLFMKENMRRLKEENPQSPQKDIMGLVGKEYQLYKAAKLGGGGGETTKSISVDEVTESQGGIPSDDVGAVVRKLDFLDLTSP